MSENIRIFLLYLVFIYCSDCVVTPSPKAQNDENAERLWKISMELVGLKDYNPFTAEDPGVKTN